MKNIALIVIMVFTIVTYPQKKKNGTIYSEHPAINTVESFYKALADNNTEKAVSYLADDFKYFNGTKPDKDAKGYTKEDYIKSITWWKNNVDYLKVESLPETNSDAVEKKDSKHDDVICVRKWDNMKGVHKETGVKIDVIVHRIFMVGKNNKIKKMVYYADEAIWQKINQSYGERKNGTIYNQHEYINKVKKMVHAYEHNDLDTCYSFYDENAKFTNINVPYGVTWTLNEDRESSKKMREKYEVISYDIQGYPDYLNYETGDLKVVMSWWNVRLIRKSDNKKIAAPLMLIHYFNDDGKIKYENAYFSSKLMFE